MDSRERLTDAMAELLWERGYAATSPRDVMERARVGQGSMYHHFTGKHDLAVAAFGSVAEQVVRDAEAVDPSGTPLERLERFVGRPRPGTRGCRVGRMTHDPQVVDDPELLGLVAAAFDRITAHWSGVVAEAVAAGELPDGTDPDDLARALVAVIQGGYVLARAQGSQEPMDAASRGAVALLEAARARPSGGPDLGPRTT